MQEQKIIHNKFGVLRLAHTLGAGPDAQVPGFNSDSFYRFKDLNETAAKGAGADFSRAIEFDESGRPGGVDQRMTGLVLEQPACGQVRIANDRKKRAISVSLAGMRTIGLRHDSDLENVGHARTKARNPQIHGMCERFPQTLQNEFYASAIRRKLYYPRHLKMCDYKCHACLTNEHDDAVKHRGVCG